MYLVRGILENAPQTGPARTSLRVKVFDEARLFEYLDWLIGIAYSGQQSELVKEMLRDGRFPIMRKGHDENVWYFSNHYPVTIMSSEPLFPISNESTGEINRLIGRYGEGDIIKLLFYPIFSRKAGLSIIGVLGAIYHDQVS